MALRLLARGWSVAVADQNSDRAEACKQHGATVPDPARGFADCSVVGIAVPDDEAVASLCQGEGGLFEVLAKGSTVVIHSTVLPETAKSLASEAASQGLALLDAPVSGGARAALDGTLTLMVGGDPSDVDKVRPLLDDLAGVVLHAGPIGAGEATKLANQLMMFAALAGVHEALDLARAYGVDEKLVLEAVGSSTGDSWVARNWGFFDDVASAYNTNGTPIKYRPWSKDLWDVVAAARTGDVRLPFAGLLAQSMADRVENHSTQH
jgi:3-hydroxyisobutyrate dehydrogenase-like beta-hydroxyacid dehydrogenase